MQQQHDSEGFDPAMAMDQIYHLGFRIALGVGDAENEELLQQLHDLKLLLVQWSACEDSKDHANKRRADGAVLIIQSHARAVRDRHMPSAARVDQSVSKQEASMAALVIQSHARAVKERQRFTVAQGAQSASKQEAGMAALVIQSRARAIKERRNYRGSLYEARIQKPRELSEESNEWVPPRPSSRTAPARLCVHWMEPVADRPSSLGDSEFKQRVIRERQEIQRQRLERETALQRAAQEFRNRQVAEARAQIAAWKIPKR